MLFRNFKKTTWKSLCWIRPSMLRISFFDTSRISVEPTTLMGEFHLMMMCSAYGYVGYDHGGPFPEESFFTGVGKNDQIQDSSHTVWNSRMVDLLCTFFEVRELMMTYPAYGWIQDFLRTGLLKSTPESQNFTHSPQPTPFSPLADRKF